MERLIEFQNSDNWNKLQKWVKSQVQQGSTPFPSKFLKELINFAQHVVLDFEKSSNKPKQIWQKVKKNLFNIPTTFIFQKPSFRFTSNPSLKSIPLKVIL